MAKETSWMKIYSKLKEILEKYPLGLRYYEY